MLAELRQSEIEELLANNSIGRIGCKDSDTVYIVPVNYRYEGGCIHCYSLEGLKLRIMRDNPDVCFEVEEIGDEEHWKMVICWGIFEEITDEAELALLRPQYSEWFLRKRVDISIQPPAEEASANRPEPKPAGQVFYRIRLTKFTGRMEQGF